MLCNAVLCDAKLNLDRPAEALIHIDAAIAKASVESTWLYLRRAQIHFDLQQYDQALAQLNTVLERNPSELRVVTCISPKRVARCPDTQFREGVKQLADRAVELNDGSADSLKVRTRLLNELSDVSRAFANQDLPPVDPDNRPPSSPSQNHQHPQKYQNPQNKPPIAGII